MRIVSLLPSATDIVCSLGLIEYLVGRTHECDWPPGIERVPAMTSDRLETRHMTAGNINRAVEQSIHSGSSIYGLDHQALAAAKPDLILTQELCEVCAVSYREVASAARLLQGDVRVLSLEPMSLSEVLDQIRVVGEITEVLAVANKLIGSLEERLQRVSDALHGTPHPRVVCVEWTDPLFSAGHWVPDQVSAAGGVEVLGTSGSPSKKIELNDLLAADPEFLIFMPCGIQLQRAEEEAATLVKAPRWNQIPAVQNGQVWVVDGPAFFNRPGPRVVKGVEILAGILHPSRWRAPEPSEARRIAKRRNYFSRGKVKVNLDPRLG